MGTGLSLSSTGPHLDIGHGVVIFAGIMFKGIGKVVGLSVAVLVVSSLPWGERTEAADLSSGEVEASFDTTLSYGVTIRAQQPDTDLTEGLSAVNRNDGASNYRRGIVSNAAKFTSDLDLGYRNFGLFLRATGFFDAENENGSRARTPLSSEAKKAAGKDIDLLDAYVTGSFDAGDAAIDLRVGKHVLNWGESTFIQSGINAINPYDVSKLRVPGAELREALVPVPLVSAAVELPWNLSLEGFYQLDWQKTVIDPVGTYFSVTDYVGPGAKKAVIPIPGAGISDQGYRFGPLTQAINADLDQYTGNTDPVSETNPAVPHLDQRAFDPGFLNVARAKDSEPPDSGQWGVAMRFLAEELNNTEFGFYFMNYHSRLPTISSHHGTLAGLRGGLAAAGAVGAPTSTVVQAVTAAVTQEVTGGLIEQADAPAAITKRVGGVAKLLAIDRYAKTGYYRIEYADDIQLYGLSFNSQLGTSGWALQGEYSLRVDAPLQRKEENLIAEGLYPIISSLVLSSCAANPSGDSCPRGPDGNPLPGTFFADRRNQYITNYSPQKINGFVRNNISQIQATATKAFGPALGADGWVFLTEAALMRVHDMPQEEIESSALGEPADATSYGYRMAVRFDYNNALASANVFPYAQFRHDVSGNSPGPGRPFVKGLTGLTFGLRADYLSRWQGGLSYTMFGGSRNKLRDRDFITATVKYSF